MHPPLLQPHILFFRICALLMIPLFLLLAGAPVTNTKFVAPIQNIHFATNYPHFHVQKKVPTDFHLLTNGPFFPSHSHPFPTHSPQLTGTVNKICVKMNFLPPTPLTQSPLSSRPWGPTAPSHLQAPLLSPMLPKQGNLFLLLIGIRPQQKSENGMLQYKKTILTKKVCLPTSHQLSLHTLVCTFF